MAADAAAANFGEAFPLGTFSRTQCYKFCERYRAFDLLGRLNVDETGARAITMAPFAADAFAEQRLEVRPARAGSGW